MLTLGLILKSSEQSFTFVSLLCLYLTRRFLQLQTFFFFFFLHPFLSPSPPHYLSCRLSVPDSPLLASQTSSLLQRWWRNADWRDPWWPASWPPSVSWRRPSCSARWPPASSTSSAGGSSRGKEVRGGRSWSCSLTPISTITVSWRLNINCIYGETRHIHHTLPNTHLTDSCARPAALSDSRPLSFNCMFEQETSL